MGVINEYFLAASDAAAAHVLDGGPGDGVIGPDPGAELASLEAILLGMDPESDEAIALVSRDDHAVDVAHDVDYSVMVIKIALGTTQLIADTPLQEMGPHRRVGGDQRRRPCGHDGRAASTVRYRGRQQRRQGVRLGQRVTPRVRPPQGRVTPGSGCPARLCRSVCGYVAPRRANRGCRR